MALKKFIAGKPNRVQVDGKTLAERISLTSNGNFTMSGRGHGRQTHHGRGPTGGAAGPRSKKRDMLYLVRDLVRVFRTHPQTMDENFPLDGGGDLITTQRWADFMVSDVQYFDCDEIYEYVEDNLMEMYPSEDVPPHPDAILPAENVALYLSNYKRFEENGQGEDEVLFFCIPTFARVNERDEYSVYTCMKYTRENGGEYSKGPFPLGNINLTEPNPSFVFHRIVEQRWSRLPEQQQMKFRLQLRMVAGLLQTINQPRFVVQGKRDVSLVKRQSFKKSTGRFTPDSWNMVTWNVDKAVKAKSYDEGSGGRQALHFRRGHWRKAEEGWERSRWSESRGRWEQYIHGYEAGHPAFGVKKSYHLPRKEPV